MNGSQQSILLLILSQLIDCSLINNSKDLIINNANIENIDDLNIFSLYLSQLLQ